LGWLLKEKWLWIIVIGVILVTALPLVIVWAILNLPPIIRLVATIAIIIGWGVAAGYKDWIMSKRREGKEEK